MVDNPRKPITSTTISGNTGQDVNIIGGSVTLVGSLVPENYDFIDIDYDSSDRISTVTYKTGGSGGTTVATLTITYVSAGNGVGEIDTITRM